MGVSRKIDGCFNRPLRVFQGVIVNSKKLKKCISFKHVSRMFLGFFKGCFKQVSRVLQESFKEDRVFQGNFKGVSG